MFFPGRMSPEKTDFSWFRRLRPAEVCDACPTGRVRWDGKAGGCLWGVPCRASPLGRKGRRIPMGCALPGESVGRLGAWEPMGFCGLLPGSAAFPGQAMGRKGGWILLRRRPTPEDSRTNTQGNERERAGALSLLPGNGGSKASLCLGSGGRGPCPCQGAITAQMPALLAGFS